jgi:uncharacterized protein (DUF433 family)
MQVGNIVRNPNILGGKPVIKGTRLSVDFILERLANGQTVDDLLEGYPQLSDALIREAMASSN